MMFLLCQTIDRSATRFPDRDAFRFNGHGLSYANLVQQANSLANTLHDQGVKRRDRVGIYMPKCLELPGAVYGIMKAGAAYVPLDPAAPIARVQALMRDCGIRHLVTQPSQSKAMASLLAAGTEPECCIGIPPQDDSSVRCLPWDEVFNAIGETAPNVGTLDQDLAYIIYTSGSTGVPKGIMHTHYSGLSYARLSARLYDLRPEDRLSNHSPLHFDMSTFDMFSGPLAGATTVIIPEAYTKLPASLSQLIDDEQLTIWYSVPFALIQLLLRGALHTRDLQSLRWILFGGEPFPTKYLHALMEQLPQARFSNVYGPAEVNQCMYYHVPALAASADEPVPIGRIWDNTEGLVVDENDREVTPGDVGELLIRSATMMRGYWNRPDLNANAFYRRPVGPDTTDIFYRTGDLVQRRDDGDYQFLGRKDRQIKTRGYRVELDEIEAALSASDHVEEAAVFAVPDTEGSYRIEAAVILNAAGITTPADLEHHLKTRLPAYAVPTCIEIVATFPRTSTGKIDRGHLQQANIERARSDQDGV